MVHSAQKKVTGPFAPAVLEQVPEEGGFDFGPANLSSPQNINNRQDISGGLFSPKNIVPR